MSSFSSASSYPWPLSSPLPPRTLEAPPATAFSSYDERAHSPLLAFPNLRTSSPPSRPSQPMRSSASSSNRPSSLQLEPSYLSSPSSSASSPMLPMRMAHRERGAEGRGRNGLRGRGGDDSDADKKAVAPPFRLRWQRALSTLNPAATALTALVVILCTFLLLQLHLLISSSSSPSSSLSSSEEVRPAQWETVNGLRVHYHLVVVDLLPYTASPDDSSGTSVQIRGQYSDRTSFQYPLCTFTRVCASSSHVLMAFSNLSVHLFYERALPYCHDRLYRTLPVCGCFHAGYRPGLLPFAERVEAEQRADAERVADAMLLQRFGAQQWERTGLEQVGVAREVPTLEELTSLPSSFPRLYPDPFQQSSAATSTSRFAFHYHASHSWSIHKWVNLHHIAHWAQKLLVMQATYAHYAHACRHRYRRLIHTRWNHWEGMRPDSVGHSVTANGRAELTELFEEPRRKPGSDYDDGDFTIDCLPEIAGVLCHDTFAPLTEHEESILDITVHALADWVGSLGDDVEQHSVPRSSTEPPVALSLHPWLPASPALPAAFAPTFSPWSSVLFASDLFMRYPEWYLGDVEKWHQQLPPPVNVSSLSCFARLSFSPMYGTFVDNAYDATTWRREAMKHYGLQQHTQHHWRDVQIPLVVPDLPGLHPTTLPAAVLSSSRRLLDGGAADAPPTPSASFSEYEMASTSSSLSLHLPGASSIVHGASSASLLSSCPPPRAVLICRPDRAILNQGEMLSFLKRRYNVLIAPVTVDGSTSSLEQARVFATAGLILSAHSSQMVNVMFAHSSAAMVEVTGEYYNLDFARYATSMGVFFRYAIGGSFPNTTTPVDPLMTRCVDALHACRGDNFCIGHRAERECLQYVDFPNKNLAFYANMTAVDIAVRQALGHIMQACYGKWQDVRLTSLP